MAGVLVLLIGIATQLPLIGIIGFLLIVIGGYQHIHEKDPLEDIEEPAK